MLPSLRHELIFNQFSRSCPSLYGGEWNVVILEVGGGPWLMILFVLFVSLFSPPCLCPSDCCCRLQQFMAGECQVLQHYLLPSIEGGAGGGSVILPLWGKVWRGLFPPFGYCSPPAGHSGLCHSPIDVCKDTILCPGMSRGTPVLAEI